MKIRRTKPGQRLQVEDIIKYKLTDDDLFRGIPTILNSELAALVVAEKLYNEVDSYPTNEDESDDEHKEE
jgi:hypothetical protein